MMMTISILELFINFHQNILNPTYCRNHKKHSKIGKMENILIIDCFCDS
jgi:hypothetical protein